MPRVVAHIQARMGSERLPGKVLSDINGSPAETRLLERLRRCETLDGIVLATSTEPEDDALEAWANEQGVQCHRGSRDDLLARVSGAQRAMGSDVVVAITGDCIIVDPELIDLGVRTFLENDCDVVSNVAKLTFPMGMDVQVYRRSDLEHLERTVDDPAVREHITLFFYEHPERYRILHLLAPARWTGPDYRFQLDYAEDHEFLTQVHARLEPRWGNRFGIEEVMALLREEPELLDINRHCVEKSAR